MFTVKALFYTSSSRDLCMSYVIKDIELLSIQVIDFIIIRLLLS